MRRLEAMADALFDALFATARVTSFALFGHSMGAVLCYELACRISEQGGVRPRTLFLSAARPPRARQSINPEVLDDTALRQALVSLGGTPSQVAANTELMELLLPVFRADLTALGAYVPRAHRAVTCEIRAYGGSEDTVAGPAWIDGWAPWTSGQFSSRFFPGGHFFLQGCAPLVLRDITTHLRRTVRAPEYGL